VAQPAVLIVGGLRPLDDLRNDALLEHLEGAVVAEEPRDADQQIFVERVELAPVRAQRVDVGGQIDRPVQRQTPLDPPRDGARLVVGEVDAVLVAQQAQDRRDAGVLLVALAAGIGDRAQAGPRLAEPRDRVGDGLGREHLIDGAGRQRAERHAVEAGRVGTLHEDHAAGAADLLDPPRAVAAAARQHDGDGALGDVVRQRAEEQIDRHGQPVPRVAIVQHQPPIADHHLFHRRQQVDRVGLHRHVVLGQPHRHRRAPRQQLVHEALEIRRQMLQDDEGHAGVGRQVAEQPFERLEAARRCADADDVEFLRGRAAVLFFDLLRHPYASGRPPPGGLLSRKRASPAAAPQPDRGAWLSVSGGWLCGGRPVRGPDRSRQDRDAGCLDSVQKK